MSALPGERISQKAPGLFNGAAARPPPAHAARIMAHVLLPGRECATECGRGPAAGVTNQDSRLVVRQTCWIEVRQGMIDGTGNMPAVEFMRLTYVNDGAGPLTVRLHQFVVSYRRNAGSTCKPAEELRQHGIRLFLLGPFAPEMDPAAILRMLALAG